jgi:NAD(P)-dependent dehydrogenase (short-subunit alcohol dehydrogenase family)
MADGRGVLVTGAAGRIGKAIVTQFVQLGDRVVATDIDGNQLTALADGLAQEGSPVTTVAADISNETDVESLARHAVEVLGHVDVLVNCAGIFPNRQVVEMDTAEWDQVFGINLRGPFMLSRAIARHMLAEGIHGSIVNISSGAGSSARTGGSHYCGSKAALEMLTKVMAIELGPRQIRVNSVAPGLVLDEVLALPVPEETNDYVKTLLNGIPLQRTGTPEDIANAVIFLCSDKATWINGEIFAVNGGSQAGRTHLPPSSNRPAP